MTERIHEEAKEPLYAGREGRHSDRSYFEFFMLARMTKIVDAEYEDYSGVSSGRTPRGTSHASRVLGCDDVVTNGIAH